MKKLNTFQKIGLILCIGLVGWLVYKSKTSTGTPQYQTETVTRGNLVVTVVSSGKVSSSSSTPVTTGATGVVTAVYVKDGDTVKTGQKLAVIELDQAGKLASAQASSSYQSAVNTVASAQSTLNSLNSAMWKAHETLMSDAVARSLDPLDPTAIQENSDWLAAEGKYKTQLATIAQAKTALSAAYLTYLKTAPTVTAPVGGNLSGFSLQPGIVLTNASTSGTGTGTDNQVGNVVNAVKPSITLNLSEIDIAKVKLGAKATVTFDALPGKTYVGHVTSRDTVGTVSSNVTTYPVTVTLDDKAEGVLPNMAATVSIITQVVENVLVVPSGAVKTANGSATVTVLKNGNPVTMTVEMGAESDNQTEIISGIAEGDAVVTSSGASTSTSTATTSVFSLGSRSFGGGTRTVIGR